MGKGYRHSLKEWNIPEVLGYLAAFATLVGLPVVVFSLKGDTLVH